jgi:hypothetical protein
VPVYHRRHRDGERGAEQRERRPDDAARDPVRRQRGERHQHGVDRLRRDVGVRDGAEEAPRRADQRRVDEADAEVRLAADEEAPGRGEALRELRVDQLVDHDPRCDDAPREGVAEHGRADDDRGQPDPGGDGADTRDRGRANHGSASG